MIKNKKDMENSNNTYKAHDAILKANIIFGLGSTPFAAQSQSVAWQAHIGGFLAGLLLFALFDPVPRVRSDAAAASSRDVSDRI